MNDEKLNAIYESTPKELLDVVLDLKDYYDNRLKDLDPIIFAAAFASLVDQYEEDHPDTFNGYEYLTYILMSRPTVKELFS